MTRERIIEHIHSYQKFKGEKPKFLILDSFTREKLRLELNRAMKPPQPTEELEEFYGIPIIRIEESVVL